MSVILGLPLLGGLYTVALDWDHLYVILSGITPVLIAPGVISSAGRPFHTWYLFLVYAMVVSVGLTALVRRHLQPHDKVVI